MTLQLVNSLGFLCRTAIPSIEGFWNLFWRALAETVQCVPYMHHPGPTMLFNDALGSMQIALEHPSIDICTVFQQGFKTFITMLADEVEHERAWARSDGGSVTLSAIVFHPIWATAGRIVANLPPGEYATAAQKCMKTLDRIRASVPPTSGPVLVEKSELSVDLEELASVGGERGEPTAPSSSHIVVDIEPKDDVEHQVSDEASLKVETGPDEDKNTSAAGPRTPPAEEPLATVTLIPFALPTPPVESATSPPRLKV